MLDIRSLITPNDNGYWSVAQCVAGRENYIADNLEERDFEVMNLRVRQRLKSTSRVVALFPGYCFVWIRDHFWAARRAPGVIDLVMNGLQPAKVPPAEITRITATLDPKTMIVKLPKRTKVTTPIGFAPGDNVKILSGQFRGFEALFDGMSARERIWFLLDMFGRRSRGELGEDDQIAAATA
jgi:transcription antitermination factor NusG